MICTLYSHHIGFDKIIAILKKRYPKAEFKIENENEFQNVEIETKGGFLSSATKLKIIYRERNEPSYQISEIDDSPLTSNLKGLYGYVNSLPSKNENIKKLFLHKIQTLNCEFSIDQQKGKTEGLKELIEELAQDFDAVLFTQPDTIISRSKDQHFLDKNLNLIIDNSGNCEIEILDVNIESVYYDGEQIEVTDAQKEWKARSEKILEERNIKINKHLPYIESENEVTIRTPKEIGERLCVLAMTNLVAFNSISGEEATKYLKEYNLWDSVTPDEKDFLANPTEERKSNESWKCECIWVLMWVIKKMDDLGFPDECCSLNDIPADDYPVAPDKDPNDFINSIWQVRCKAEILATNDLYYRLDWACVDARINNLEMTEVHPGVVYERHYALNWLINYADTEWDDVTCDT
ncbi:MAG: DUF4272 domain-containing protein [Flavobacterium sp.]